jgi:hypothetical protein
LNCPDINWQTLAVSGSSCDQIELLDFAITSGFQQLVAEPTRGLNSLDVVLANDSIAVCDVRVVQPFYGSDHEQVEFSLYSCNSSDKAVTGEFSARCYDWNTADFDGMTNYLDSVDWNGLLMTYLTADSL